MNNYAQKVRESNLNILKLGIVSSRQYNDSYKIQQTLQKLINKPYSLQVYSAGSRLGGELYIKRYSLEYDFFYREFNPAHTSWNQFSALPKYRYGKAYKPYNFKSRYKELVEHCSKVIIFYDRESEEDSNMEKCIEYCIKFEKPYIVIV